MSLKKISKKAFNIALIILVYICGGISASIDSGPFSSFAESYVTTSKFISDLFQQHHSLIRASSYPGEGVVKKNKSKMSSGLTVLQGYFPGGNQAILINSKGKIIHNWQIDFLSIWPNPQHIKKEIIPNSEFNNHTQGMIVNSDGSIVVNVSEKGTAKLNKCNEIAWTIDHLTHHSITKASEETYWIPTHRSIDKIDDKLLLGLVSKQALKDEEIRYNNEYEQLVTLFDHNGNIIKEFSVLKALIQAGFERHLYDSFLINIKGPTHINDIEIVTQELANKIKNVAVGDLLVSIRQMHMLVIMDQHSGEIKWNYQGSWIRQHDPDITSSGNIRVFNNATKHISLNRVKGSNLIELNPATNKTWVVYPKKGQQPFYSDIMGTHQELSNGNILITESRAGRVFEITVEGEIVWDFILPFDGEYASLITSSVRLENDFFNVDDWHCPNR